MKLEALEALAEKVTFDGAFSVEALDNGRRAVCVRLLCAEGAVEVESINGYMKAFRAAANALPALLAQAQALEWCESHGADVEFNHYPDDSASARVKHLVDLKKGEWRERTAPTFVQAVTALRELEARE